MGRRCSALSIQDIAPGFAREAEEYPFRRAYVFGPQARGDVRPDSDIDILLDVDDGFSLFDLCGLTEALQARFGVSCDVVTRNGLKDSVRASAERDEVLIYERA